ncbi:DsrE family protein [Mesorhizobium sp. 1M-11]|uniref:DsrE family protein n=1 Tax=Mesorhizobium sp. 1M-11 TaxID=1529006 RepID=UPI0006C7541C|nr:DsrE family protein [Mesorhizobium sp. 1M-11]
MFNVNRRVLGGMMVGASMPGFASAVVAAERYADQKVVYHVNDLPGEDGKHHRAALNNVQNHIDAVGKGRIEVKVVLHGDGVEMLRQAMSNDKLQSAITSLKTQNVQFLVCNNTLTGRNINADADLFEVFEEDIVPSGVAELSNLQQKGFTYVKP